jgi:uncharacterized protein
MKRYLDDRVQADLAKKMVFLTGPRQVGKTTFSRQLITQQGGQYLKYDVPADRAIILHQRWNPLAPLLVLNEIHKMPNWKAWLKGVVDGKPATQRLLVTGSARMDTFRQSGEALAGRFFGLRLHPISVREWCEQTGAAPDEALTHLLERGGFPEPCLATNNEQAERWRRQYFEGLVRNDVLEFSRIREVNAIRLFAELLRSRVGSPLSLASIGRDLAVSPVTLKKYLDILETLYIVLWCALFTTTLHVPCCKHPRCTFTTPAWWWAMKACALKTWSPPPCTSMCSGSSTCKAKKLGCTTSAPKTGPRWTLP